MVSTKKDRIVKIILNEEGQIVVKKEDLEDIFS